MEEVTKSTPNKEHMRHKSSHIYSPGLYNTPIKQSASKRNPELYSNDNGCFNMLPTHITPPSGLTKFIARNPFEHDLTNRLHMSVISPTVFSKFSSPSQSSPGFAWSVEELALIQPAKIEECPIQQVHCIDPEVETKAQAAIDKFFNANKIVPSPWEDRRKEDKVSFEPCTPTRAINTSILAKEGMKTKKEAKTQTVLSLPPELPPEVEAVLKPYFTYQKEQNTDSDDANSSNSSLRRKLFFNHDECFDDDNEDSIFLTPEKMNGLLNTFGSPPQSGMFVHGTPVKKCSTRSFEQYHGTPVTNNEHFSLPNMSPIYSKGSKMSGQSVKSCCLSVTRLDFTADMSIEQSLTENKASEKNELMDISNKENCIVPDMKGGQGILPPVNGHEDNKNSSLMHKEFTSQHLISMKGNERYENIANGMCSQDTGYQTCSISNIASIAESCNFTPGKDKLSWNNRILTSVDDVSDWKESIKNVFCSTPSKCNKEMYS